MKITLTLLVTCLLAPLAALHADDPSPGQHHFMKRLINPTLTIACTRLKSAWQAVLLRSALATLMLAPLAALHAAEMKKPNIIIMLADDLGYADLGCQGSPDVKTPNIDSIAANGVRCTAGYVTAPQCSPSRAALMSGRYQQRFGHETNRNFPLMLMGGGKTIADHLKAAGYATAHFGKWHLGFEDKASAPKEMVEKGDWMAPTQHGFDESFGYVDYAKVAKKGSDIPPSPHAQDDRVFARKAVDFSTRHREQPFFIYLGFHAPHTAQVDFGGYKKGFPSPGPGRLNVLTVMAQEDDAVGQVQKALRDNGLEENTLIIFTSDNGGTRTPETPTDDRRHYTGSFNAPYLGAKGNTLEGGIREPFIVQWKGHLPVGKTYDRPVSTLDVLPTVVAAAQAKPLHGVQLDGVNLLPFLLGEKDTDPHEVLFWRWSAYRAVRMGDWKLVREKQEPWRLIDLSHDVKEEHDLSAEHPEKVKELLTRYENWEKPLPPIGPNFKDKSEGDNEPSIDNKK